METRAYQSTVWYQSKSIHMGFHRHPEHNNEWGYENFAAFTNRKRAFTSEGYEARKKLAIVDLEVISQFSVKKFSYWW